MTRFLLTVIALLTVSLAVDAPAQDIRAAARRAAAERELTEATVREAEVRILTDRHALTAHVDSLEAHNSGLATEVADLEARQRELETEIARLEAAWSEHELDFRETTGNVRLAARDVESLLDASPLSAGHPERVDDVGRLLAEGYFPDLDDISALAAVLMDEIVRSGQVAVTERSFVGRNGEPTTGRVYQLGKFTTLYETDTEQGFLTHLPKSHALHALSRLPDRGVRRMVSRYLSGESGIAPVDMSAGAALRQITASDRFIDQVREGGPLVWPILLLAVAALVIVVAKFVSLRRIHANTDELMGRINDHAAREDWEGCESVLAARGKSSPVVRIVQAGLAVRGRSRATLESVLQEAILQELPTLQRGMAILSVLGAVAPLLGLLGTVTGMIETFRVITVHGTGDPRLMSGGISEALVTTELGLAVAIPIMLLHTVLARRVDHVIGDMEKQAVHMTTLIAGEEG